MNKTRMCLDFSCMTCPGWNCFSKFTPLFNFQMDFAPSKKTNLFPLFVESFYKIHW